MCLVRRPRKSPALRAIASACVVAIFFRTTTPMLAAEAEDGWHNLTKVTRDRSYTVLLRDARCLHGPLISVNDQAIVLGGDSGVEVAVKRADVLRFPMLLRRPLVPLFSVGETRGPM